MSYGALIALHLIILHGPDNQRIAINADEISSLRAPGTAEGDNYAKNVKCVVIMTNGKFIAVIETCRDIYLKTETPP